jgi:hypothetical protein
MANDPTQRRAQRIKRDSRKSELDQPVGYQNDRAETLAWAGDDDAPYVKVINDSTDPVYVTIAGGAVTIEQPVAVFQQPLATNTAALLVAYEPGVAATEIAKASAGRLYQIYVSNESGGVLFFQIHNLAAVPGAVAPYITPWRVPSQGALFVDFGEYGLYMGAGITMASSSTFATFTAGAGLHMTALYF